VMENFPLSHFDCSFSPSSGQAGNTCNGSTVIFWEKNQCPQVMFPGRCMS